jgi:hypothetical protein
LIGSEQISNGAVYGTKIANDAVGSQHLANNAVSYATQIKDGIVGYAELTTGLQGSLGAPGPDSIGTTELKEPAVGSENLYNGAVYGAKIANDAVGSQHLANNAVSYAAQIKDGIVGYAELTAGLQGSLGVPGPDSIGTTELKEPAVGSENIYSQAVYGAKIKNNAVGSQQLANAGVISTKIANDAVGSQHLANNAVSYAAQIKDGIVGYAELTSGLQGSFVSNRASPYAGDDSEITVTGQTPGTIKIANVLKDAYVNPLGSIKIAAQLKADVGTYNMRVQLGTVHVIDWEGTETTYKVWTGSVGVGAESDGVLALRFMLVNSRAAGVSSNKLVDIITIQP